MIGQRGISTGERTGGVEKYVAEVSERLGEKGHDVTVYARRRYATERQRELKGVSLRFTPVIYSKRLEAITHTFTSTIDALFRSYDILHYHGVGPATLAWIPRIFSPRKTIIVTFHSRDRFHQKWGWFGRAYLSFGEWAAVRFSHYCITVSHEIQVHARGHFHREAVYIPNGAEVKRIDSTTVLEGLDLEPRGYLLFVGRLVPQKGLHFLIEAFRNTKTKKKLVIVGSQSFSGNYERRLRTMAKGDDRIRFVGFRSGQELDELFAHAYLYIHPSEAEGMPIAVLEAMGFGTAPLVSSISANVEAIHGSGFTFQNKNVDDLRRQLSSLLKRPGDVRSQGASARAVIEREFNWDVIVDRIESVYITARH